MTVPVTDGVGKVLVRFSDFRKVVLLLELAVAVELLMPAAQIRPDEPSNI